jgi:uncharacterized protein
VIALLARRSARLPVRALRGLATLAGAVVLALFVVVPIGAAMWLTGKPRQPLTASLGLPHADVTLRTDDGVRLAGWYVPSRNGAAVVLVHGGGGDRGGVVRHARLLAQEGYGVLLYDERGRGESGGQTNGMGWDWHHDVSAAVDWLEARGVHRVGALGLSTGAEAVVTAAAHDPRIEAVVAEGVINRSSADTRHLHDWSAGAYWWVAFKAIAVQTHDSPPEPLTEDFRRVAPRPLLLIAAAENPPELKVSAAYRRAAGPTASFWLARTGHTHTLAAFPAEYRRRVVGFLDRGLAVTKGGVNRTPRHVVASLAARPPGDRLLLSIKEEPCTSHSTSRRSRWSSTAARQTASRSRSSGARKPTSRRSPSRTIARARTSSWSSPPTARSTRSTTPSRTQPAWASSRRPPSASPSTRSAPAPSSS